MKYNKGVHLDRMKKHFINTGGFYNEFYIEWKINARNKRHTYWWSGCWITDSFLQSIWLERLQDLRFALFSKIFKPILEFLILEDRRQSTVSKYVFEVNANYPLCGYVYKFTKTKKQSFDEKIMSVVQVFGWIYLLMLLLR